MSRLSRKKRIMLLPFLSILATVGWIFVYFGGINFHTTRAGFLTANEKIVRLQKQLENAIVEERQGIMLGFLGVCALVPFILYGNFPSWAYVAAGIFSILGYATMAHGNKRKVIIKGQLFSMSNLTLQRAKLRF
jgi:hypothetical protein